MKKRTNKKIQLSIGTFNPTGLTKIWFNIVRVIRILFSLRNFSYSRRRAAQIRHALRIYGPILAQYKFDPEDGSALNWKITIRPKGYVASTGQPCKGHWGVIFTCLTDNHYWKFVPYEMKRPAYETWW